MAVLNPTELFQLLKKGNPKEVAIQLIQTNFANDPLAQNLMAMGQNGDQKGLEEFATKYFSQYGRDFNTEMNNLMNAMKNS